MNNLDRICKLVLLALLILAGGICYLSYVLHELVIADTTMPIVQLVRLDDTEKSFPENDLRLRKALATARNEWNPKKPCLRAMLRAYAEFLTRHKHTAEAAAVNSELSALK